ncbi:hypothetical protein CANARDRAFT_29064 [[Candida] arabinofermentans NRRL YB-2248]|uniref:Uncharacterized protein n=1 Tax=[Candida] arabinofermentans NRRL YB-2248 TaxID=983967 RepID=A0A1E4SYF0_9ASCO|nr:hypothetical protein CANARDRAFT_29064 [[Candida] arabinofermentans NRRL YB-2248]
MLNYQNGGGGIKSHCFMSSIILSFKESFINFINNAELSYVEIFKYDRFFKITTLKNLYSQILNIIKSNTYSSTTLSNLKNISELIQLNSKSYILFKKYNHVYSKSNIIFENKEDFKKSLLRGSILSNEVLNDDIDDDESMFDESDYELIRSDEFKNFNYQRLVDLGFFQKTIFKRG